MPLDPPPRDLNGGVIPHDHPGIVPDDGIIRRVSPYHFVIDPKANGRRLSTMAFQPSTDGNGGMSVDIERLIVEAGLDPKTFVISPPWTGAVRFEARTLREEGLKVGYDPLPDNPYHGEVWGQFSKRTKQKLLSLAQFFVLCGE